MREHDDLVQAAREFCRQAHHGQLRHDGSPYAQHPLAVADLVREHGNDDPEVLAAALLHDVLEDTPVSADELRQRFGSRVTAIVEELTNRGFPGRTFEQKHAALAEHARHMSNEAKWIKLADRLHNLTEMTVWDAARQQAYARVTVDLLEALRPWPSQSLADAIRERIAPWVGDNVA